MKITLRIILFLASILVLGSIVGISESFADNADLEFGEYHSLGNTWIELTYSYEIRLPWTIGWSGNNPGEDYPKKLKGLSGELEIIKLFYKKYDIEILDVMSSDKNAQVCEAEGCIHGTYHLLISEEDNEKFQIINLDQTTTSGIYKLTRAPQHPPELIFNIPYNITNGIIKEIEFRSTLTIIISANKTGALTIEIPKQLHYVQHNNPPEDHNEMYIDGKYGKETKISNDCTITYSIPFHKGSQKLEIIGWVNTDDTPILPYKPQMKCPQESTIDVSPLKQMKLGLISENVVCNNTLDVIYKVTNNSPACVKTSTVEKLIERGWAKTFFDQVNTKNQALEIVLSYENFLENKNSSSQLFKVKNFGRTFLVDDRTLRETYVDTFHRPWLNEQYFWLVTISDDEELPSEREYFIDPDTGKLLMSTHEGNIISPTQDSP